MQHDVCIINARPGLTRRVKADTTYALQHPSLNSLPFADTLSMVWHADIRAHVINGEDYAS